jgi:hypothetical protein
MIKQAFRDSMEEVQDLWDEEIKKDLSSPNKWIPVQFSEKEREISKYDIGYARHITTESGTIRIEIELFRDGFHITPKNLRVGGVSSRLLERWKPILSQTVSEVAPKANEMVDKIISFLKN